MEEGALDPICQMTINENGSNNQWLRLCKSALGSLYFKTIVKHPKKWEGEAPCILKEVSFRTDDARKQVENKPMRYYEWMVPCTAKKVGTDEEVHYFISRAYASNQVFVYGQNTNESEETVYLKNLSRNISVVETEYVRLRNQLRGNISGISLSSVSVEW